MYMNGRGPMMGGHRGFGPMGGPVRRPMGMGFRPMIRPVRVYRGGGFGGLFILPALLFGGWIAVAVLGMVLGIIGSVIGGIFEGLSSLGTGAFSGTSLAAGVVLGLAAFMVWKNRNARKAREPAGEVDGEEVETQIEEPAEARYSRMG